MRGITLSYSRLWFEIVSISSCDLFAFWLRKLPAAAGDPLWIRLVAGREPEPAADALEATLVSTGLMVLLRLLGTAAAQCHGNHSRFTEALALTLGTWIAWKGAFVLLMSLLRGSMMP
jgi:hypothetical protein